MTVRPAPRDSPRLLLVGEDALARAGLRALADAAGAVVVAEAEPGEVAAEPTADAAVWELGSSVESLDALRDLAAKLPTLVVLWSPEQARDALAAGARGLLLREELAERLASAVAGVADGLLVLDPALAETVLRPAPSGAALVEALTPRESEVLALLVDGLSNRAIAGRLGISEHTAKFHVNSILGKLGAQSRGEAVAQAARLGLVTL